MITVSGFGIFAYSLYAIPYTLFFMRTILPQEENPALRQIAKDIPPEDISSKHLKTLIAEMKELLSHEEYGVALAAPQLGESLKLFIVSGRALSKRETAAKKGDTKYSEHLGSSPKEMPTEDQVYINPVILKMSRGKKEKHEGCLSIRGKWGTVPRAEKATVRALDEYGREFTRGASGFLAHIFQHEMDHLSGILYIDKATDVYDDEKKED
jgi:peptide deformylase